MKVPAKRSSGYTLVEMVSVMTILSVVGLATSFVILESMRVYARTAPSMDASYQARLAIERMRRELRSMKDTDSISVFTGSALTFDDSTDNTIAYGLSAGQLQRNGVPLAHGVTALAFSYWAKDGSAATTAEDLHLVDIDLTVLAGDQAYRQTTSVFPRFLTPAASSPGSSSPTPIGLWNFDETSGSTVADSIAGNDGSVQSGATPGLGGAPSGNYAVGYDGTDDHIEIPHSSEYLLLSDGSVQAWFNADTTGTTQGIFSKDSTNYDTGGHFTLRLIGDDIELRIQSTSQSYYVQYPNSVSSGSWYHVVVTFGSGGLHLYVNGQLRDSDAYTGGLLGNTEPIAIGANAWQSGDNTLSGLNQHFDGRIDAVAIYDQALTASEVLSLYSAGGAY